jgi:D-erythronate 2-dehydrogenase
VHVAVTVAAGMIGRKLTDRLVADGHLDGVGLDGLSLFDVVEPATPEGWTGVLDRAVLDLAGPGAGDAVVARRPEVILHLAAIVSGEASARSTGMTRFVNPTRTPCGNTRRRTRSSSPIS